MTHWMCTTCGYYLQAMTPPNRCPSCTQTCVFNDVTCYRPECGGEQNLDPLLVGATLRTVSGPPSQVRPQAAPTLGPIFTARIFDGLTDAQIAKVKALGHTESYRAGAIVCMEGAESRKLYLVEEGQVAVEAEVSGRARVPVSVVSPGESFGWSALVPPYRLTATNVALTDVRLLAIEREPLMALLRSDSALCLTLMQNVAGIIASRLRNLEQEMTGLIQG